MMKFSKAMIGLFILLTLMTNIDAKEVNAKHEQVVKVDENTQKPINDKINPESVMEHAKIKADEAADQVVKAMTKVTTDKSSVLGRRIASENIATMNPFGLAFYKPTYVLPFYYTGTPYYEIYQHNTPEDQPLLPEEFKAQLSLQFILFQNMLGKDSSINLGYTQIMYWQFYALSQYFRETDYEPDVYYSKKIVPNWWIRIGAEHQSNGRGGDMERSWNRAYFNLLFSRGNWMVSIRPWIPIFKAESSDLHNPDIARYLGYGETVLAYKAFDKVTFSLMLRNMAESGFKRGAVEFDMSFPIYKVIKGYVQVFSGYGQSLIEYDHHTSSIGVGIALSDWI